MFIALFMVYAVLITPLSCVLVVAMGSGRQTTGALSVTAWGVRAQLDLALIRREDKHLSIQYQIHKSKKARQGDVQKTAHRVRLTVRTFKRANIARRLLNAATKRRSAEISAVIGLSDAAATAVCYGACDAIGAYLAHFPRVKTSVKADFSQYGVSARARCILRARLGSLLLCAGLAYASYARSKRKLTEGTAWNGTPSAT